MLLRRVLGGLLGLLYKIHTVLLTVILLYTKWSYKLFIKNLYKIAFKISGAVTKLYTTAQKLIHLAYSTLMDITFIPKGYTPNLL